MRYDKDHKARTREKIEAVAARRFREEGIDAVGVASLMDSAGLTHGGFYAHFDSKEALVEAALEAGFAQAAERLAADMARYGHDAKPVAFAKAYLSERHRDEAGEGCVAAALAGDVARRSHEIRERFTQRVLAMVEDAMPDVGTAAARRDTALAVVALSVGAMVLARAVDDPKLSKQLLSAGTKAAAKVARS